MFGRRKLLTTFLGASQVALLGRFATWSSSSRAGGGLSGGPTKLLSIYVPGGLSHELMWGTFRNADVPLYVPAWDEGGFDGSHYENLDGSGQADADAPVRRLRGPVTWNWDDPAAGYPNYSSNGYVWAAPEYGLYERTAVIHGIDQGTASHPSGVVSAMCGIAGANYAAPAIPAVVANHFMAAFPDRALPSVVIGGGPKAPAMNLAAGANPTKLTSTDDLLYTLSDEHGAWEGFRSRTDVPDVAFDGMELEGSLPLSIVDRAVLRATRAARGRSSTHTDVFLESLHDQYKVFSRTLASDITAVIEGQTGVEHLPQSMPWAPTETRFGWRIGVADDIVADNYYIDEFDLILRLLKSDVCTCVTKRMPTRQHLDNHSSPYLGHRNNLRGTMEALGRLLLEMQLTPSASDPSRSLLDETQVYIFSEFGRSFMEAGRGGSGSDHHPMTSAVLVGGNIQGNRMIGGFSVDTGTSGIPVELAEEGGESSVRPPRSQDTAATVFAAMGMTPGEDFFLPGGYGVVEHIVPNG
ncbi:MAG: DUF1501 domain-containing protein [Nannocystaceae bacterium]|nr:DUF1501 domain-containing protein [Nannocystaceae bacterium]